MKRSNLEQDQTASKQQALAETCFCSGWFTRIKQFFSRKSPEKKQQNPKAESFQLNQNLLSSKKLKEHQTSYDPPNRNPFPQLLSIQVQKQNDAIISSTIQPPSQFNKTQINAPIETQVNNNLLKTFGAINQASINKALPITDIKNGISSCAQTNENNRQKDLTQNQNPKFYSQEKKPSIKISMTRGLANIGNTCYVNAALQCLQKSIYFTKKLKERNSEESQPKHKLVELLCELDNNLNKQTRKPFVPRAIKQTVAELNRRFYFNQQNDAMQFISNLLMILSIQLDQPTKTPKQPIDHKKMNEEMIYQLTKKNDHKREYSIIDELFTSRYRVGYTCQEKQCKFEYIMFQKFNIHYVQIPKEQPKPTLVGCFRNFQKADELVGDNAVTCDRCQRETDSHKTIKIYSANKILMVVLKRFVDGRKNEMKVQIPQFLSLEDIMSNRPSNGKAYRLYAACLHIGTVDWGHYTAVCLDRSTKEWVKYNDSSVSVIGSFDRVSFNDAYGLFYEECSNAQRISKMGQ